MHEILNYDESIWDLGGIANENENDASLLKRILKEKTFAQDNDGDQWLKIQAAVPVLLSKPPVWVVCFVIIYRILISLSHLSYFRRNLFFYRT